MLTCRKALAAIFILLEAAAAKEKGFLAFDREATLWNAFQDSERRLHHTLSHENSEARNGQIRAHYIPPPAKKSASSDLERWQELHQPKVWLVDPADGSGEPLILNYSVEVTPGLPVCEERIQVCIVDTTTCRHVMDEMQSRIIEAMARVHHNAYDHPLLNTLEIGSAINHDPSVAPSSHLSAASQRFMAPDRSKDVERASSPVAPPGLIPGKPKELAKASWLPSRRLGDIVASP